MAEQQVGEEFALPEIKIPEEGVVETEVSKLQGKAAKLRGWVSVTIPILERWAKADQNRRRIMGGEELAEKIVAAQKTLEKYLFQSDEPLLRQTTWLGLFEYYFSKELRTREEVEVLLKGMVNRGYLVEGPGPLKAFNRTYAVPEYSLFETEEKETVREQLRKLLDRVWNINKIGSFQRTQELLTQATINREELLTGQPGVYACVIPPQKIDGHDDREETWLAGGTLSVKSDGRKITPVEGVGRIASGVQEAKELEVFLRVEDLSRANPPYTWDLEKNKGKKVHLLWHLLQRGFRAEDVEKKVQADREKLATKAKLSPPEFFLERMVGPCLVEYHGLWTSENGEGEEKKVTRIPHLFFLVERQSEDEEKTNHIQVLKIPKHLPKDFFEECMDKYPEGGNRFEGCPQPLQAVLQAIYGQLEKAARIKSK